MDCNELQEVVEFVYLGSLVTADNDTSKEIRRRILAGNRTYFGLRKTLTSDRPNGVNRATTGGWTRRSNGCGQSR